MNIILGSNSPRRKELLSQLGFTFEIRAISFKEQIDQSLDYKEIPKDIVSQKLTAMINKLGNEDLIICADTLVFFEEIAIGKPSSKAHAVSILNQLSGKTHEVITAVGIAYKNTSKIFSETTEVSFNVLSAEAIHYYVETYTPLDKAGAYGIQEWIGLIGVSSIKGSYTNVMGLPTQRVFDELTAITKKGAISP
jgi:septum formation protein